MPAEERTSSLGRGPTGADSAHERSLSSVFNELSTSLREIVRSEIHLAKAELKVSTRNLNQDLTRAVVFGTIALLGVLPLIAFLVIGLGSLLGGSYALSALIVAAVFLIVGGTVAYGAIKRLKQRDLSLPRLRESIKDDREILNRKIHDISDETKRRVS